MHTALWCLCATSVVGAFVAAARPSVAKASVPAQAKPEAA